MLNSSDVFERIGELEFYVNAIDRDIDNYDIALATCADIKAKLAPLSELMPVTALIIVNYIESIERRINDQRIQLKETV